MRGRRGFTLIELLVVIGIMVVLMGLLGPMIMAAWRSANRTRLAADLSAIGGALEAYRQDHGSYPPVKLEAGLTSSADRPNPPTGAQILCFALIGPAQASEVPTPTGAKRYKQDGLNGPGFRTKRIAGQDGILYNADDQYLGKSYGPYIAADRFKIADPAGSSEVLLFCILDYYERPVLYFPASATKVNVRVATGAPYVSRNEGARFDANDNFEDFRAAGETDAVVLNKIRWMFGDANANGYIDGSEQPVEGDFALWSAGPDDIFGPKAEDNSPPGVLDIKDVEKCDDVTTFR